MKPFGSFYAGFGKLGEAPRLVQFIFFFTVATLIYLEDSLCRKK